MHLFFYLIIFLFMLYNLYFLIFEQYFGGSRGLMVRESDL